MLRCRRTQPSSTASGTTPPSFQSRTTVFDTYCGLRQTCRFCAAHDPFEWDPTAKKWECITPDQRLAYSGWPYACWDSVRHSVIIGGLNGKIQAYYPTAAYGSRAVPISGSVSNSNGADYARLLFEPVRNRAVQCGGLNGPWYCRLKNEFRTTVTKISPSGDTGGLGAAAASEC